MFKLHVSRDPGRRPGVFDTHNMVLFHCLGTFYRVAYAYAKDVHREHVQIALNV
jgi:hypothetical protein